MDHSLLNDILILLVLSVGGVAAFRIFNLPPILGYLMVGALAGEHAFKLVESNESIEFMGEVGVVFLLFAIGLEFSIKQLLAMKTTVLGLGGLQVTVSILISVAILNYFGVSWQGSVVASSAMAMSSTAIVMKQLNEQNEMRSLHGKQALGILLFQDIAVVPFLVVIPILAGSGKDIDVTDLDFMLKVGEGIAIFAGMLAIGHFALRPFFHLIAKSRSEELFNITILLVALAAAWMTDHLGLSLALGAFIAGIMLNETEYRHQIEAEIRPFRDILMGIFFITIGTRLNIFELPEIWPAVVLLVISLTIGKAVIIYWLTRLFKLDRSVSLRTGLILAHGGEFGFALLAIGSTLLKPEQTQAVLAAIVISMVISPFIIKYNGKITRLFVRDNYLKQRYQDAHRFSIAVKEVKDHVIICGYRRIGQNLGKLLREQGIEYIALEMDPKLIKSAWDAGDDIYYGDATRPEILIAAGLYRAKMVVITTVNPETSSRIIESVRKKEEDIPILVRTRDDMYMEALENAGATDVIPETLEATMTIAQRVLHQIGIPEDEVFRVIEHVRQSQYNSLRSYFHGEKTKEEEGTKETTHLHTIILKEEDYAIGKKLDDLYLARFDAKVTSLRRGRVRGDNPDKETVLQKEDALVIQVSNDKAEKLEQYLRHQQ